MTIFLYCFFYHIKYEKNMTDLFKELELSLFCHFLCNKLVLERHRCRQNNGKGHYISCTFQGDHNKLEFITHHPFVEHSTDYLNKV